MSDDARRRKLKASQMVLAQFLKTPAGKDSIEYLSSYLGVYPLKAKNELDTYFNLGMLEVIEHLKFLGECK